jgi:mono/diheme cytochrome c family protein
MTFLQSIGNLILVMSVAVGSPAWAQKEPPFRPEIPKVWDEQALATWATPVAGLNVRPGHFSEAEYYRAPLDNYRTYPVYAPGREPAGYWEMLQKVGPKPLIDPSKLQSKRDWIQAGQAVFEQADHLALRSRDPKVIAAIRSPEMLKNLPYVSPDGTLRLLRWVPTEKGVAIGHLNCGSCHTREETGGTRFNGPPTRGEASSPIRRLVGAEDVATSPFHIAESLGEKMYRAFAAPWVKDDVHERLKEMSDDELTAWSASQALSKGVIPRWNGSAFFPAKVPDLIGVADRKYLDHTGTHANRGIADLMRYAALVSYAESAEFGPHQMVTAEQRKISGRLPDEAFYALALYIQSLQPPPNPNHMDHRARAGQQIFTREGCPGCHTPGLYTNNKLTLAKGFVPLPGNAATLDVLRVSVGTDPNLALKTRKGTGYYKVPSLRGVWYRGHFLHDGSIASLEEMFDPDRLKDTHQPGGWNPPGVRARAVPGHEFGLRLDQDEKASLIAFLKTL